MKETQQRLEPPRLFISHAAEDKDSFVRPLADALIIGGFRVWFDEYSLALGDSLKKSIDAGLAQCDFGIVVLSHAFFVKQWPREELDGLAALENARKTKVVLPIWHEISLEDITQYSPTLAGKLAVRSSIGIARVVATIRRSMNDTFSYVGIDNLERRTIHLPAAFGSCDLELLKLPEVSWEVFGQQLLKELRRLDDERQGGGRTPNKGIERDR